MRRSAVELAALLGARLEGEGGRPVTGVAIDSRAVRPGDLFVALPGERTDGHEFVAQAAAAGAAAALVSQAVTAELPMLVVPDTLAALQRLARAERAGAGYRLAAITGSIGKTTTKEFLVALLATTFSVGFTTGSRNSQAGFPAELCNRPEGIAWMVAELGMNHAGELDRLGEIAEPDALLYTVVAPVHLEFFADVDAIAEAKAELIPHLRPEGLLILNAADRRVAGFASRFHGNVVRYGVPRESDLWLEDYRDNGLLGSAFRLAGPLAAVEVEWSIPGRHQADNLLAAATLALAVGVAPSAVGPCTTRMRPAPRRGEVHTLPGAGITVVDDSYNSSPQAAVAVLAMLAVTPGRRVAVLGEMLELGPSSPALHREVGRRAATAADVVVAVGGECAAELARAAKGIETHHVAEAGEALALLRTLLRPGDVVLIKGSRGIGLDLVADGLCAGVA
ncbi:MAG TPA: UDP-N-acetylmuramoyl-tripeptide--D-alanyl-D-alanine ligase [Thermoanaerobaculaceae bacterium]|nr:UDP-N-acetylmuramoyl-tripeptide--D-alanyl-D-alanine ligase [Thermoanaerobaculaceae bacterium]